MCKKLHNTILLEKKNTACKTVHITEICAQLVLYCCIFFLIFFFF